MAPVGGGRVCSWRLLASLEDTHFSLSGVRYVLGKAEGQPPPPPTVSLPGSRPHSRAHEDNQPLKTCFLDILKLKCDLNLVTLF